MRRLNSLSLSLILLQIVLSQIVFLSACTRKEEILPPPPPPTPTPTAHGTASFYSDEFQGKTTASGETFDQNLLTAAHKSYPFGTLLKVTNKKNHKSVIVRVNDRGPFIKGRVIDLSEAAAKQLGFIDDGKTPVSITVLKQGNEK